MIRESTTPRTRTSTRALAALCALLTLALCLVQATQAHAANLSYSIDTEDDAYVSEGGSGDWTTEHDAVYQTYVGDTLDFCSDMSLDPVLAKMNEIEANYPGIDTSGIALSGTNGDLTVTISVPKGLVFDVSKVYMVDNDLYQITGTSTTGTVTGPGTFTVDMGLKQSYTSYDALKAGISGLNACDMAAGVPNDGFQHEIRVVFPGVKVTSDIVGSNVTMGSGTMSGAFSATASMYGGLVTAPFQIALTSHQYAGGLDATLPAGSTTTSVTAKVSPATSVVVTKAWNHGTQAEADWPTSSTVDLVYNGQVIDTATLSAANSWKHTFDSLDPTKTYTVVEEAVTGYTSEAGEVTGNATDGYAITFTNTYIEPATPPAPESPTTPTAPTTPTQTQASAETVSAPTSTPSATPATGDASNATLALAIGALSAALLAAGMLRRKDSRQH